MDTNRDDEQLPPAPLTDPGTGSTPSSVLWPEGPHYFDLTGSQGTVAWIRYRVWAADWHTRTLREIAGPDAHYDRFVGIEMALDGALNNLSSAFDAAVGLLIETAENALEVPPDRRRPVHRYNWAAARHLLKQPKIGTDADGTSNTEIWRTILDIDNALAGEADPTPEGWLAQLRRRRNRVAHKDTLARHHHSDGPTTIAGLEAGADAFAYLTAACDQIHDLTEPMIALAVRLGAPELAVGWPRPRWDEATS